MCLSLFRRKNSAERLVESDSDKALIDRTIISEKELDEIRYLKSLRETRNRVSIVPQQKTILEDSFLEPLAEETGIESSKDANKLSKKDRKRLLRKMIETGNEMDEKKENEAKEMHEMMENENKKLKENINDGYKINGSVINDPHNNTSKESIRKSVIKNSMEMKNHEPQTSKASDSKPRDSKHFRDSTFNQKYRESVKNNSGLIQKCSNTASNLTVTGPSNRLRKRSSCPNAKQAHFFIKTKDEMAEEEDEYDIQKSIFPVTHLSAEAIFTFRLEKFRQNTLQSLTTGSYATAETNAGTIVGGISKINLSGGNSALNLTKTTNSFYNLYNNPSKLDDNPQNNFKTRLSILSLRVSNSMRLNQSNTRLSTTRVSSSMKVGPRTGSVSKSRLPGQNLPKATSLFRNSVNSTISVSSVLSMFNTGGAGKYNKTVEESMKLVKQKSCVSMMDYEGQKRATSTMDRNKDEIKLVANEDNRSAYPMPGTGFSTKLGGSWKVSKANRNILTESEVYEVINSTLETQQFKDESEADKGKRIEKDEKGGGGAGSKDKSKDRLRESHAGHKRDGKSKSRDDGRKRKTKLNLKERLDNKGLS